MVEVREAISVTDALEEVMRHKQGGKVETVSFHDCDLRRLAKPIIATDHVPSFHKSPYDGFAMRSIDTNNATKNQPVQLKIVEHIGAGELPSKIIQEGEAIRIMTGASIPDGADCVEMFEKCEAFEENDHSYITIDHSLTPNQNVIGKGSEVKKGTTLIDKGVVVDPGVKASLATFGYDQVQVAKKPVVGVIATGTELLDVHEPLEPGKIRNSNAYMICSQIARAGGEYMYLGTLADELESSYETIKKTLTKVDILVTTGGVSVGDFDLMPAIYEKLGADVLFNKVAMRPGSVTTVATLGDQLLFGLSGNPSACYVGFELFARPTIQSFLYTDRPYLPRIQARLAEDFPKNNPFTRFVRTFITYEGGRVNVHLAGMDKSNVVTSLAHTTSLLMLPAGTSGYTVGSEVEVLLLDDQDGQAEF